MADPGPSEDDERTTKERLVQARKEMEAQLAAEQARHRAQVAATEALQRELQESVRLERRSAVLDEIEVGRKRLEAQRDALEQAERIGSARRDLEYGGRLTRDEDLEMIKPKAGLSLRLGRHSFVLKEPFDVMSNSVVNAILAFLAVIAVDGTRWATIAFVITFVVIFGATSFINGLIRPLSARTSPKDRE